MSGPGRFGQPDIVAALVVQRCEQVIGLSKLSLVTSANLGSQLQIIFNTVSSYLSSAASGTGGS